MTGSTSSTDFPTTPGALDTTSNGAPDYRDAFVVKLNDDGSTLVYSTYLGGAKDDAARGIAVDGTGSAYVTGSTFSSDFPTTPGAFDTTLNFIIDAFVVKLSASGSALEYGTYLGGSEWNEGTGIAVDGAGSAYTIGFTFASDFPTTPGAFDTTSNGSYDAFVAKLSGDGSSLVYGTYLKGHHTDYGRGISVDGAGNAYATGQADISFPTTPGTVKRRNRGGWDAFVTKFCDV